MCYILLRPETSVQLWEVLVRVEPEYRAAVRAGRLLAWLGERLPRCFVRVVEGEDGRVVEVEEPDDWEAAQKQFRQNYDALMWLSRTRTARAADREPELLSPAVSRTLAAALKDLRLVIASGRPADPEAEREFRGRVLDAELTLQFSSVFLEHGHIDSITEFWQIAFVSFFRPDWLPWRGSYCGGCWEPLPPTKKLGKPSGTKLCSGCRVKKCRTEKKERQKKARKGTAKGAKNTNTRGA